MKNITADKIETAVPVIIDWAENKKYAREFRNTRARLQKIFDQELSEEILDTLYAQCVLSIDCPEA